MREHGAGDEAYRGTRLITGTMLADRNGPLSRVPKQQVRPQTSDR